jgi:hypothetical protein
MREQPDVMDQGSAGERKQSLRAQALVAAAASIRRRAGGRPADLGRLTGTDEDSYGLMSLPAEQQRSSAAALVPGITTATYQG